MEAKISALETLAMHTGNSLAAVCKAIDGKSANTDDSYHCCVNAENNKLYCATTEFATILGISTTNGVNACDTTNTAQPCLAN